MDERKKLGTLLPPHVLLGKSSIKKSIPHISICFYSRRNDRSDEIIIETLRMLPNINLKVVRVAKNLESMVCPPCMDASDEKERLRGINMKNYIQNLKRTRR